MDNRWRFLYCGMTELWGHVQRAEAGNGKPGASEVPVTLANPSWLTELFIWKTEKSKEYTPRKNFGSYLNLIVNTWVCELLIYRRYSRQKPTCLRLPLYWSCGM